MALSFLLFLACAKPQPPSAQPEHGKIGVHYKRVDNWMLVTDVIEGMSADTAGILPGDRLLEVNGEAVFDGEHNRIMGPAYTQITLTVQSPFEAPHSVELVRGLIGSKGRISSTQEKVHSLISTPPFDRQAWFEDPVNQFELNEARRRFWSLLIQHPALDSWSETELQGLAQHVPSLSELELLQSRFPNWNLILELPKHSIDRTTVWNASAEPILFNGWPHLEWRSFKNQLDFLKEASEGDSADLIENTREAAQQYHWDDALMAGVSMAPYSPAVVWSVPGPPPILPEIKLLDGSSWQWESPAFTVVNLWATWCGPCRKEMPEFVELSKQYSDQEVRFIAVSTDRLTDRDKVEAMANNWDLPFAVAHEPRLNRAFQVTGIPAIRVLNPDGQLVYRRKGFSPTTMDELSSALELVMEDPKPLQRPLAYSLTQTDFELVGFISVPDLKSFSVSDEQIWLSRHQHLPVLLDSYTTTVASAPAQNHHPNALITHELSQNNGPIVADYGGHLIHAYDKSGQTRWMQTTRSPIQDLHLVQSKLYVQTETAILVLEANGAFVHRFEGDWLDIEKSEQGVWALGDSHLFHLRGAQKDQIHARPDGAVWVHNEGQLTQSLYSHLIGSMVDNGDDAFLYRPTHGDLPAAVLFGGVSKVFQTLFLSGLDHQIGLWDSKKDGDPELVIAFPNVGIALFRLNTDQ